MDWPKGPTFWTEGWTLCVSIPFTWDLPGVRRHLERPNLLWDRAVVGGPAVRLMPDYFDGLPHVEEGTDAPGVLQRVNPMATRTTTGCPRACGFCGVRRIEPEFRELDDWQDLPILADNNLLAASPEHFDRVMDRLERWTWADFTQGVDSRLLNAHHAERMARLRGKRTRIRLALDSLSYADAWEDAFAILRRAGVPKAHIVSYAIVGFRNGPDEAWRRCDWIESHGVKALPMWFHPLDAMARNQVTPEQESLGWSEAERKRIMQWFYKHRGERPMKEAA